MCENTLELEEKINNYENNDNTVFIMLFCSNGFKWGLDELLDFVFFYRNGCHRPDDVYSTIEIHSMEENGKVFLKNIDSFCYLERGNTDIIHSRLVCGL